MNDTEWLRNSYFEYLCRVLDSCPLSPEVRTTVEVEGRDVAWEMTIGTREIDDFDGSGDDSN